MLPLHTVDFIPWCTVGEMEGSVVVMRFCCLEQPTTDLLSILSVLNCQDTEWLGYEMQLPPNILSDHWGDTSPLQAVKTSDLRSLSEKGKEDNGELSLPADTWFCVNTLSIPLCHSRGKGSKNKIELSSSFSLFSNLNTSFRVQPSW